MFIAGERKRAVRIQVDPAKLAAMGLTLEDIRQVLVNATADAPKGTIDGAGPILCGFRQRPTDQSRRIRERHRRLEGGRADPRQGHRHARSTPPENRFVGGFQNGTPGVILLIFKQPGANVIDTVERIKATLPRLEASIPPSIKTTIIVDRTQTIRASVPTCSSP